MRVDFTTFGTEPPDQNKAGRTGQNAAPETAASAVSASTSGEDQTSFSFDPGRVQTLAAQVLAQPEVRESKVQTLQQSIGRGEYSIPASQVADAMMAEMSA